MIGSSTAAEGALQRLRWPMPALLAWALGWAVFGLLNACAWPGWAALLAAALAPVGLLRLVSGRWRRGIVALGFPLSALLLGAAGSLPPWAWLLPLALLLGVYPLPAWRDAPLFPTPAHALDGLDRRVALPARPRLLDAGCGLGDGLQALRRAWPQAQVEGLERSALLALAAQWRCRWAAVRRADMWGSSWAGHDLVYLFQRPESMARAWAKACAEMAPGSWIVSLEFPVPGRPAQARLQRQGQRPVWAYRIGASASADPPQPRRLRADMSHRAAHRRAAG